VRLGPVHLPVRDQIHPGVAFDRRSQRIVVGLGRRQLDLCKPVGIAREPARETEEMVRPAERCRWRLSGHDLLQ
jgi:hypothetical protein